MLYLPHFYPSFSPTSSTQPLSHTHSILKFMTSSMCTWVQSSPCRLDNILGGSPPKKTWFSLPLQSPTACRPSSGDAPCEIFFWLACPLIWSCAGFIVGSSRVQLACSDQRNHLTAVLSVLGSYNLSISSLAKLVMLPESQGLLNDTYLTITTTTFLQIMPIVQESQNSMLLHFSE